MKTNKKLWLAFIALLFLLSVSIHWALIALSIPWASVVSYVLFFGVLAKAVIDGWTVVPENWDLIVEIFGAYIGKPLKPRLYVLFPWFGFVKRRSRVFKGVQLMELYLDENVKTGYGGGDVEFEDCSSKIRSFLYFQIIDSERSTYATNDLFRALEEKTDSLLRSFLGLYKLEEVIKMKSNFYLEAIATLTDFCPDASLTDSDLVLLKKDIQKKWRRSEFYRSLTSWGVKPVNLVISDIELTEILDEARRTILTAEKEMESAKIKQEQAKIEKGTAIIRAEAEKAAAILKAEGEKQREVLLGEGSYEQIKKIAAAGIPKGQISKLLIKTKQWEAIEKGGNTVTIIEDGSSNGSASNGAKFGAGFSTNKKSQN